MFHVDRWFAEISQQYDDHRVDVFVWPPQCSSFVSRSCAAPSTPREGTPLLDRIHGPLIWTGSMDHLYGPSPWTPYFLTKKEK